MDSRWRPLVAAALFMACPLVLSACPGATSLGEPYDLPPLCGEDNFRLSIDQLQLTLNRNVDILFVIDNSGTMAEEQVRLAEAAGPLFERLDDLGASYRIAFTTTDSGNPWCPSGTTTPEAGSFVLSPCTERLADFLYNNGTIDAQDLACNDLCNLDSTDLMIAPTTTDVDSEAKPRPWIERTEDVSNLPATTDPTEAFACFAPQGINGCGFESQLESMYLGLIRAQDSNEDEYGFLRPDSVLAVVVLSDEADCSYNKDYAEIFDPDGSKSFWSDPDAAFPSSAVCWNAGVSCEGDPSGYDGCEPMNYDLLGESGAADADAVLHPMSRYAGLLNGLETVKQQLNADQEIIVSVIAGGEGNRGDWTVNYAEADDPDYQLDFGIGPGCVDDNGDVAVPPVRMRALAEEFAFGDQPASLHSVCDASYDAVMADLGERIADQMPAACYTSCIADGDLSTPWMEPDCRLEEDPPGNDNTALIEPCLRDGQGYLIDAETGTYQLPEGADACFVTLIDPDGGQTPDPHDDMSAECVDQGFNLEFKVVRREGVPAPAGTSITADCALSGCPEIDCPGIGG